MKLFATLCSMASAAVVVTECPNDGWTPNADNTKACTVGSTGVPVTVTCGATKMTVAFNTKHIYKDLAITDSNFATTNGQTSDGTCKIAASSNAGALSLDIALDGCGTTVTQAGGKLTFKNTITGDSSLIKQTVGGVDVWLTQLLEFDVECKYTDTRDVKVDALAISTMDIKGEKSATGEFAFNMDTKVNGKAIDANKLNAAGDAANPNYNPLVLGEKVGFEIYPTAALPSTISYHVTGCSASGKDASNVAQSFPVIKNNVCTAEAVKTDITAHKSKLAEKFLWELNAFSFDSNGGEIKMECDIKLCTLKANGDLTDASCPGAATACSTAGYKIDT